MLAPEKKREDILAPMAYIGAKIHANTDEKKHYKKRFHLLPPVKAPN